MHHLQFTRQAELDLLEIWQYIADDSPAAADRTIDRIESTCRDLQDQPHVGRQRPELMAELRSVPVGNYLLLYRVEHQAVQIIRVLHGARDLDTLL